MSIVNRICLGLMAFGLGACSFHHSAPSSNTFIEMPENEGNPATRVQLFADANGTFYPSGWADRFSMTDLRRYDSLRNAAVHDSVLRALINQEQVRQIAAVDAAMASKKRVFILIHGYNNSMEDASRSYDAIEAKVPMTAEDGVVRFYWDGLTSPNLGSANIWFNAAGYSQMVGSHALRRVLNVLRNKDVYLIGHSRGTSVILSALGDPVYAPKFLARTEKVASGWGADSFDVRHGPALKENNNRLRVLALAPAVDRIDFCDSSQQEEAQCGRLRDFPRQLKSFRYTVNQKDPILDKFVGLSAKFNPTGLGYLAAVGERLKAEHYPQLQAYVLKPARFHGFRDYVAHPEFDRMLRESGL